MNRFLQIISLLIFFVIAFHSSTIAQKQNKSTRSTIASTKDTGYKPRTAIIRSAILPGWGQITNKKYWKLPLVYGALGTTTYLFFRNIKQFNASRNAYNLAIDGDPTNDDLIPQPYYSVKSQPDRIKNFRNEVRQNADYCALLFIFFWGLNVVDAAVDAHLKMFDVSDNLSLQLNPGYSPLANTNGISLILRIK